MSSLSIAAMREELIKAYGGAEKWRRRVYHMSDSMVLAVYRSFLERGLIK